LHDSQQLLTITVLKKLPAWNQGSSFTKTYQLQKKHQTDELKAIPA
jgi:hypothetical protein